MTTHIDLIEALFQSVSAQPTRTPCPKIQLHGSVCALHSGHPSHCFVIPACDPTDNPFSEAIIGADIRRQSGGNP